MIDAIQNILQPLLADYLAWALMGVLAWFLRWLPAKWRVEVEARHREALHRALNTGIGHSCCPTSTIFLVGARDCWRTKTQCP